MDEFRVGLRGRRRVNYYRTGSKETQHFVSHRCDLKPSHVSIRRYKPHMSGGWICYGNEWRLAHLDLDSELCCEYMNDIGVSITYCPWCGARLEDA